MERKTLIWIGLFIGSSIGGVIPMLWNASPISISSTLLGALGGIAGIWLGFKVGS